ncbi:MAG: M20/M25/M40 family metallo-hydrolase [Solobacterium sp.]|nr:M20/M25/M40 family metallo-hydrolase [Solobacterium sp.]
MKEIERIKALSDAFGPSGFEDDVAKLVKQELKEFEHVKEDKMRNVTCVVNPKGKGPRVMLDAHLDEVGLIVQAIKPNGTMNFLTLGRIMPANLPSSSFKIRNKKGKDVEAVIAAKPPHFSSAKEKDALPQIENMVLDCGSVSQEMTEKDFHIGIASPAVPNVTCTYDEEKRLFFGKAFDCRIGVAAEIETLKRLKNKKLPCVLQASFASQEEVGDRGVYCNYKELQPDVMICFEGCPADDTFQEAHMVQAAMYKGPMLRHFDVSMITHPRFQKFALDVARKKKIPVQESVRSGGGTNAGRIHLEGVPCIVIGIPVRYIHSSNCYCTLDDYDAAVNLAVELVQALDAKTVDGFQFYN